MFFSRIETFQRFLFYSKMDFIPALHLIINGSDNPGISFIRPIYPCPISRTAIFSLTIEQNRINGLEEQTAKGCKADELFVIYHLDALDMTGLIRIDLFV